MSHQSVDQTAIVKTLLSLVGRSTLPVRQARSDERHGTAFWFDDLVAAGPDGPVVRQYLVTADAMTRFDLGELVLRPELCDPPVNPDVLLMPGFAEQWIRLERLGLAVMPTTGLHAHAERRGWRWTTDPVDDGLAAAVGDLAALDGRPAPAYAVGHPVPPRPGDGSGPAVVAGHVYRRNDNTLGWQGAIPDGLAGAPVLAVPPGPDGTADPLCIGALLPGRGRDTVVTFDHVRLALSDLAPPPPPPPRPRWPRRA
ncbi:hypothetical protein POF50_014445 [Streptomyces sp. SL13]|uniref:Uncharacterized protein n=1 Tax=Streptantibioticus silvisoli TaxID=2705255 RepID=A0AA90K976_9ACTN|nr:hypothetical protein [Streptantibioticus silvisoli]MDI5961932.1 hypothetical protein [Streptantibioticus silvisoli]MDI5970527.1 hypothetical protein [Streptantibioticus silvisoli]